ncbi:hypothetical protein D3C85_1025380 [compost metagenome]
MLGGAVLKLVQKHIAVGLTNGISCDFRGAQNIRGKRYQLSKFDLSTRDVFVSDGVVWLQRIAAYEYRSEAIDDAFSKTVKGVTVEA